MTKSDTSPQEPNPQIFLENILITHINGHLLEQPCAARVVLHLSPANRLLIESENFPIGILNRGMEMPHVITVKDKRDIGVIGSSLGYPGATNRTARGSLELYKCPCTVIRPDAKISSISFSVLNFLEFYGQHDKWVDSERLGATELVHNNLQISLTQTASFSELKKLLVTNGYGVTHRGVIERCDGETFSVEEAEQVLRGLRSFLSFARGARCGVTLVKAAYPDVGEAFLEWGSTHVDPWRSGYGTWMPTIKNGSENLSKTFAGFWALYSDQDWKGVLLETIDWYISSKSSSFHVGIILIQVALECLCCKILDPKKKKGPMGEFLSESIKEIGLCTAIPSSCRNLNVLFQNSSRVDGDGPKAIVELRNDLVHAKNRHGDNPEAQIEALRLGKWYLELILLKQFDYRGRYVNRLAMAGESSFEKVPWANGDRQTEATN